MWELFAESRGSGRPFDKRSVLVNYVAAMSAYRIPCPASQELQLRAALRWEDVKIPIYETWSKAWGKRLSEEQQRMLAAQRYEYEDEDEDVYEPQFSLEEYMQQNPSGLDRKKGRWSLPHPLLLLLILIPFLPP
jgi:hypothetical protein